MDGWMAIDGIDARAAPFLRRNRLQREATRERLSEGRKEGRMPRKPWLSPSMSFQCQFTSSLGGMVTSRPVDSLRDASLSLKQPRHLLFWQSRCKFTQPSTPINLGIEHYGSLTMLVNKRRHIGPRRDFYLPTQEVERFLRN